MIFIVLLYIVQCQFTCKYENSLLVCRVTKITKFIFYGLPFEGTSSWSETNLRQNEKGWKKRGSLSHGDD